MVLHLYCPDLFPEEVLKLHAEHLGHFLALQSVPKINQSLERTLFEGLCGVFTRDTVLSVYRESLTDETLRGALVMREEGLATHPSVFVKFSKNKAKDILSLLRNLLNLFDKERLCDDIPHVAGEEPEHMLFLYLIQLMVIFVSGCIKEKDLATIMSVASSVFLEANMCHPLCAATILKPMFIPYYEQHWPRANKRFEAGEDCEARLKCYRLFTGYELSETGSDISGNQADMTWTEHGIVNRIMGYKIAEQKSKKLWFVAPQMGDRLAMIKDDGLKMMGGQTGEKASKIASYLVSDNVMAYMQCAVFGTVGNMLPCHANSDFTEAVMATIKGSMSSFSEVARHQSSNLMTELRSVTESSLHVTGVGFAGQDKGDALYFGKVYTGPEEKRPAQKQQSTYGTFTSVTLGTSSNTMINTMLNVALNGDPNGATVAANNMHSLLSTEYKPVTLNRFTVTDMYLYARYHHNFNTGEFTEVATVKNVNDKGYNSQIHQDKLSGASKYQLTVSHGGLSMCVLTLAMTMRQAVIMVAGFICAELARVAYTPKVTDASLCRSITNFTMSGKFKHRKDDSSNNTFDASYGELLKLTGPVFTSSNRNRDNLDNMEWLNPEDKRLPDYIRKSLNMIGCTRREVEKIMNKGNFSYNRVVFMSNNRRMETASLYENEEFMVHAPLMILCNLRIFATASNSYASVKLCKKGSYYPVNVFSNRCVDTNLYYQRGQRDLGCGTNASKSNLAEIVEKIKREVSCVLPSIHANRIKMLAPDIDREEFESLVSNVKSNNIQVIGQAEFPESHTGGSSGGFSGGSSLQNMNTKRTVDRAKGESSEEKRVKLASEDLCSVVDDGSPPNSPQGEARNVRQSGGDRLTIFDADIDFGFDNSD